MVEQTATGVIRNFDPQSERQYAFRLYERGDPRYNHFNNDRPKFERPESPFHKGRVVERPGGFSAPVAYDDRLSRPSAAVFAECLNKPEGFLQELEIQWEPI